jgi:hypothetical protein
VSLERRLFRRASFVIPKIFWSVGSDWFNWIGDFGWLDLRFPIQFGRFGQSESVNRSSGDVAGTNPLNPKMGEMPATND